MVGEFEDISAELAVLAGDHLFARGLTAVPLLRATAPVTVAWDFATGELNVAASGAAELTVQAADGPRTLAVAAGQQRIERFEGVTPAPAPLAALSTRNGLLAVRRGGTCAAVGGGRRTDRANRAGDDARHDRRSRVSRWRRSPSRARAAT